ncbi:MAG: sodium:calcium antiporter, partial [Archaeoglobaceae archaeon]
MNCGELKNRIVLIFTFLLTVPWFYIKLMGVALSPPLIAFFSGLCVVAAGFLLAWACETAEMDVPKSLAVAVVALIAVLPEYAVDGYL